MAGGGSELIFNSRCVSLLTLTVLSAGMVVSSFLGLGGCKKFDSSCDKGDRKYKYTV